MSYSGKLKKLLDSEKVSFGDVIKVVLLDEDLEGVIIERPDYLTKNFLILKLRKGYNIGISPENIREIKLLKKYKKKDKKEKKVSFSKDKPVITILHTGGTIASRVDYRTGGVVSRFTPRDMLEMFPKLKDYANIRSVFMHNMFSEDMRFSHYEKMSEYIVEEINDGVDGIIITHGTDTMGYTSAALSFIFDNLPIPIILVGAQRSSDRGSSDAEPNLICAANFIANSEFTGVGVCMHEGISDDNCLIHKGVKVRKMHSSRRDAFKTVNDSPTACINYYNNSIEFLSENYKRKDDVSSELVVNPDMEDKVGILRVHTNMFPEQVSFFRKNNYKGLVIEGTGLGHLPINNVDELTKIHKEILNELKKLIDSGCVVVMTTQAINGRVNMNVYSTGRFLKQIGVIPARDMLTETAFIKLAWLLKNVPDKAEKLMVKDLRGEITERTVYEG